MLSREISAVILIVWNSFDIGVHLDSYETWYEDRYC